MRGILRRSAYFSTSGLAGIALLGVVGASAAAEQTYLFNIPAEGLGQALTDFSRVSSRQIIFSEDIIGGRRTNGLQGRYTADEALAALLADSDLRIERSQSGVLMVQSRSTRAAQTPPPGEPANTDSAGAMNDNAPALQIDAQDGATGIETVVVSSSRITASGFSAPTPTTVLGVADIQQNAQPNVFTTISELPALQGSTGTEVNNNNSSTGANGLSSFNLRGLGTIRTLTLIDGQRIVPAYVTGIADVSELPQLLIQRVDVVTGGASASWGSDAVGGVVNFVTDKKFNGIKGNIEGGVSNYGDETSGLIQLAAGTGFLSGRGHIEASGEFYRSDGVPAPDVIGGALTNGRCCNYHAGTLAYTVTTTPAGVPEMTPILYAQNIAASEYGLITSGPLKGTSFDSAGNPTPFQYGSPCVGNICQGGDLTNSEGETTIDDPITRTVLFGRLSYAVSPTMEIYGTVNLGNVFSTNSTSSGSVTGLAIQCGNAAGGPNAYLPASINAACAANNITSFTMGESYDRLPPIRIASLRQQRRYVAGTDGSFNALGSDWTYDAYFQHGENDTSVHIRNMSLQARSNIAADAIAGPGSTVVCRSVAAQASGCVPYDPFIGGALSSQVLNYIDPAVNGPYSLTHERQEVGSFSLNGTPFKDWAGDVALAFGAEYREEAYSTIGDPYGNGVTATDPFTAAYPADPILNATGGNNWLTGNYHNGSGNYHVSEGFIEAGIPLIDTGGWGRADLDLAGRGTGYSTSGFVDTWKVGATWDTPLDGVRLRALQSRDVRAPNLSELFAAPITSNVLVINRLLPATAPTVQAVNDAIGDTGLKPETAQTTGVGLVFQPDYIPGFSASVDYYRVAIKKQIGALTNQQIIDLCQLYGNTSYCSDFNLNGAVGTSNPNFVTVKPFNLAQTVTDGFDLEASYQFDLQAWDIPGSFALRGLSTHISKFITNAGIPGQPLTESAGSAATGGVALWKSFITQGWKGSFLAFNVTERFFSDGAMNPYDVQCQAPNCPAPTIQNPTISMNHTQGPFFVDIGGSYQVTDRWLAYFKVDNLTNYAPRPFAQNTDPVGRMYRIGVRFN